MGAYQTIVVGTHGSDSPLRAVDRAGAIAADHGAKLIVASAHLHPHKVSQGGPGLPPGSTPNPYRLKESDSYRLVGAPIYAILREGRDRAKAAGAPDIEERPIVGPAVNALVHLAEEDCAQSRPNVRAGLRVTSVGGATPSAIISDGAALRQL